MKKRFLWILPVLALVLCAMSATVMPAAAAENHGEHESWTAITADMGDFAAGNYVLNDNIVFTSTKAHNVTGTVTICLNGYTLDVSSAYIEVEGYDVLNICDCAATKGKLFTDGSGYALDIAEATVNLENCVVEIKTAEAAVLSAISMMYNSTLNCINSSVLVAEGSSEAVNSIYAYQGRVNVSGSTISRVYLYNTSSVYLAGKNTIDVIQFCNKESLGQIYVTEKPSEGSSIGLVFYPDAAFPFYAVQGTDTYTITDADTACFQVLDNSSYQVTDEYDVVRKGNALAAFAAEKEPYVVVVNETSNGTVTSDVELGVEDTKVTLTIQPDEGYELDELTYTGSTTVPITEAGGEYSFTMPASDVTVTATFKEKTYPISIGAVSATNTNTMLEDVVLEIYNSNNRVLENWTSGYNNSLLHTADLTAGTYTLKNITAPDGYVKAVDTTFTIATDGTVTVNGDAVTKDNDGNLLMKLAKTKVVIEVVDDDTGEALTRAYVKILDNDEIEYASWHSGEEPYEKEELTAGSYIIRVKAPEGYEPASSDITFTIDEDGKIESTAAGDDGIITVELTAKMYSIAPEPCMGGSVSSNKSSAKVGEQITLTAEPWTGYELNYFSVQPGVEGTRNGNQYTFSMPAEHITISAGFNPIGYTVTLNGDTTYITNVSDFNNKTANYEETVTLTVSDVPPGSELTITVKDENNQVVQVTGPEGSFNGNYTFKMPASAVTITASSSKIDYNINKVDENNRITNISKTTANYGDTVTVTVAETPVGYKLSLTAKDAENKAVELTPPAAGGNEYTFAMPASNVTVTAEYAVDSSFGEVDEEQNIWKDGDGDYYQKDEDSGEFTPVHVHTATVGGKTEYTVFTSFFDTVNSIEAPHKYYPASGNYYVAEDVEYNQTFYFGRDYSNNYSPDNVVLCMNGKTWNDTATSAKVGLFVVDKDSSLTVIDCTGEGVINSNRATGSVFQLYGTGSSLVVKDITATNQKGYGVWVASNDVSVDLEDVKISIVTEASYTNMYNAAIFAGGNRWNDSPVAYSNVTLDISGGEFTIINNQWANALSFRDNGAAESTSSAIDVKNAKFKGNISVQTQVCNTGKITLKDCDITGNVNVYAGAATLNSGKVDGWVYLQRTSDYDALVPAILLLSSEPEITQSIYVYNSGPYETTYNKQYLIIADDMKNCGPYPVTLYKQDSRGYEFLFAKPDGSIDLSGYADNFTTPYNYTVRHNEDDGNLYVYIYPYISDKDGDTNNEVDSNDDGIYEGSKGEDVYLPDGNGGYIEVNPDTDGDGIYEDDEGTRYIPVDTSEPADGKYDDVIIDEAPVDGVFTDDNDTPDDESDDKYYIHEDKNKNDKVDDGEIIEVTPNEDDDGTYTDPDTGNKYQPDGEGGFEKVPSGAGGVFIPSFSGGGSSVSDVCDQFPDVNTDLWYHDAIHHALTEELMKGYDTGLFGTLDNLNRAMLVQILYRLEGEPAFTTDKSFSDVGDTWYTKAVLWAAENGIVEGYDGKFSPNADITREQLATILYRYARYKGIDVSARTGLSSFADGGKTSSWAKDAAEWAVGAGVIGGKDDGYGRLTLDPTGTATRAEVAQMLLNFWEKILGR